MNNHSKIINIRADDKSLICPNSSTAHIFLLPVVRSRDLRRWHSPISHASYVIFGNVRNTFNETMKQKFPNVTTYGYTQEGIVQYHVKKNQADMLKTALSGVKISWKIHCQWYWRPGVFVSPVNPKLLNHLTPNGHFSGRTSSLTSRRGILYIYSTNICTEYFKHVAHSPFFPLQNAVYFIMLPFFGSCIIHILNTGCAKI